MRSAPSLRWLLSLVALCLFSNFVVAQEKDSFDEDSPEVKARVARISFIRGDVQIKRSGERDWENATLNLPLVEGDEIATTINARIEIQFDRQNFLRLAANSFLKITTLRDEGIAVSLTEGLLSLRVFKFEKGKGYFEIDAPQTTVSAQNAGLFRVDATNRNQIKVTATEGGEARVYSDSSGFTLRNGRNATIFLSNDRLGEWETGTASNYYDEWDTWVAERDAKLSLLLNNDSNFADRDMYGAEELNNYGSWSDSSEYGKVWRPNYSSISSYSNWSPYRYGNWRWVNPFGWTWVNDEPWGWATYHHGRWVNDSRGWFWTPNSYHRAKRNWWKPALVFVFNIGNDICWYPLSHRDRYDDYNRRYRQNNGRWDNNRNNDSRDFRRLPENSIIAVRQDEFGRRRHNPRTIPNDLARRGWENNRNENARLPRQDERRDDFRRDVRQPNLPNQNRVGVGQRQPGVQLDPQLQNERFRRNRQPENSDNNERNGRQNRNGDNQNQPNNRQNPPVVNQPNNNAERRQNPPRQKDEHRLPVIESPQNNQNRNGNSDENNRQRRRERDAETDNQNNNRRESPTENRPQNNNENRRSAPPVRVEEPRREQPRTEERREQPRREEPRVEPRREQPRQEEPRREEPRVERRREEPRQEQPRVEPRREEPRREQPRQEQPRREEPKVERRQEERKEQPRREEPRKETPREERRSAPPPKSDNKRDEQVMEKVDN